MVLYFQEALSELEYNHDVKNTIGSVELTSGSRSTFNIVTSTKVPEEIKKVYLTGTREAFNARKLSAINWCSVHNLAADGLTKDNRASAAHLAKNLRYGLYPIHSDTLRRTSI